MGFYCTAPLLEVIASCFKVISNPLTVHRAAVVEGHADCVHTRIHCILLMRHEGLQARGFQLKHAGDNHIGLPRSSCCGIVERSRYWCYTDCSQVPHFCICRPTAEFRGEGMGMEDEGFLIAYKLSLFR